MLGFICSIMFLSGIVVLLIVFNEIINEEIGNASNDDSRHDG